MPTPVSLTVSVSSRSVDASVTRTVPHAIGELDGVGDQIPDHLLQPFGIAGNRWRMRGEDCFDPQSLRLGRRPEGLDRALDQMWQLDPLDVEPHLAGDDPRDVEHILDDLGQRRRVALDGVDRAYRPLGRDDARLHHPRVAEDRVQRRAQLVRQRRQELVLEAARFLDADVQLRVLKADRPRADAGDEMLVLLGEAARLRMAEEQATEHLAGSMAHRHGQIAAHRQVPGRHALVRRVVAVARVARDVIAAHDAGAAERRLEHPGIARHREFCECVSRDAGQRARRVGFARGVDGVVEEGAKRRRGELGRRIGHRLHHLLTIERARDDRADLFQPPGGRRVLLGHRQQPCPLLLGLASLADVAGDLRGADDPSVIVANRWDGQ